MAIDTAVKRASVLGVGLVFTLLVIPDSTIAQADRQTIANSYGGILASAPVIDTEDCFLAFQGAITDREGFIGFINDDPVAVIGLINDDPVATIGTIFPNKAFEGPLTDSEGFEGEITDSEGFEGDVCDC